MARRLRMSVVVSRRKAGRDLQSPRAISAETLCKLQPQALALSSTYKPIPFSFVWSYRAYAPL
ncbi:hypothetical protein PLICRDRAFT_291718 [Plicaturopsis crispa FD-325 SS-3]|nr:hypothetical protein PLICRDRAFT_291718 [Plicaturopsis crispa FD-325 SS-3]